MVNIFGCPLHPGDEVLAAVPFPVVELRDAVGVGSRGLFDYFSVHCYSNFCPETKIAGRVILNIYQIKGYPVHKSSKDSDALPSEKPTCKLD